MIELEVYLF